MENAPTEATDNDSKVNNDTPAPLAEVADANPSQEKPSTKRKRTSETGAERMASAPVPSSCTQSGNSQKMVSGHSPAEGRGDTVSDAEALHKRELSEREIFVTLLLSFDAYDQSVDSEQFCSSSAPLFGTTSGTDGDTFTKPPGHA